MKVYVIGSGLAGLTSALLLAEQGHRVTIISRGIGGLLLSTGTIDVLGWNRDGSPVRSPFGEIDAHIADHPDHPYAAIGVDAVRGGVEWLRRKAPIFSDRDAESNALIPTAVGAVRPTAVVQETMDNSVLEDGMKLVVVGIHQFKDFPAHFIADNLSRSPLVDLEARALTIDLEIREPEADSVASTFARGFDGEAGLSAQRSRDALINALAGQIEPDEIVLLPAILGFNAETFADISHRLGARVGEVPVPPPSVAGRRINDILVQACHDARIDIHYNAAVIGFETDAGRISHLQVQRAGRVTTDHVDAVVYAGGGFESGTLTRDPDGTIVERVFKLPLFSMISTPDDGGAEDIFGTGVRVDEQMRPVDGVNVPVFNNLHCAGSILGGAHPWDEKSGEGIALGSAWAAAHAIGKTASEGEKAPSRVGEKAPSGVGETKESEGAR